MLNQEGNRSEWMMYHRQWIWSNKSKIAMVLDCYGHYERAQHPHPPSRQHSLP